MCPVTPSAFRGVLWWWAGDVVDQRPRMWWTSHTGGVDRTPSEPLELSPSGGKTVPRNTTKTNHEERGDTMNMRHAAPRRTNVATRRPLKRSSETILAAIIYLTASCLAVVGTLGVVAAIWTLWGAIGAR